MSTPASNPPALPMSRVRRVGDLVFVSGTVGVRDKVIVGGGVDAQVAQIAANIDQSLQQVGGSLSDVVRCLCIVTDAALLPAFNAAYGAAFAEIEPKPTRATIIAGLPNPAAVVEIEAVAAVAQD